MRSLGITHFYEEDGSYNFLRSSRNLVSTASTLQGFELVDAGNSCGRSLHAVTSPRRRQSGLRGRSAPQPGAR